MTVDPDIVAKIRTLADTNYDITDLIERALRWADPDDPDANVDIEVDLTDIIEKSQTLATAAKTVLDRIMMEEGEP
jgi:hypothetical protein